MQKHSHKRDQHREDPEFNRYNEAIKAEATPKIYLWKSRSHVEVTTLHIEYRITEQIILERFEG